MARGHQSKQPTAAQLRARQERAANSFDAERVRDVSVTVYKARLNDSSGGGNGAVERMLADDRKKGDATGKRLRDRAGAYDPLTRAYMRVLGDKP